MSRYLVTPREEYTKNPTAPPFVLISMLEPGLEDLASGGLTENA